MKFEIKDIWSPDLNPPGEGLPQNIDDFEVFIQVCIGCSENNEEGIFNLTVCSPSIILKKYSGSFLKHILVIDRFDWTDIRSKINFLLSRVQSYGNWENVIDKLACSLKYADSLDELKIANGSYEAFKNDKLWPVIDGLIKDLEKNNDLNLTTHRDVVVGYLVKHILKNK